MTTTKNVGPSPASPEEYTSASKEKPWAEVNTRLLRATAIQIGSDPAISSLLNLVPNSDNPTPQPVDLSNYLTTTQIENRLAGLATIPAVNLAIASFLNSVEITSLVNGRIAELVGNAPDALDTIAEISPAIEANQAGLEAILTSLAKRLRFDAAQTLSAAEQLQARNNIGAIAATNIANRLRFDTPQTLTDPEKQQARDNIGAMEAGALDNLLTSTQLTAALATYVTQSAFNAQIAARPTNTQIEATLSNYLTGAAITNFLTDQQIDALLDNRFANYETTTEAVTRISNSIADFLSATQITNQIAESTATFLSSTEITALVNGRINELVDGADEALDTIAELGSEISANQTGLDSILIGLANRVRFDAAQTLDDTKKQTARNNIGAIDAESLNNRLRFDSEQTLDDTQKQTARDNIGAIDETVASALDDRVTGLEDNKIDLESENELTIAQKLQLEENSQFNVKLGIHPANEAPWEKVVEFRANQLFMTYGFTIDLFPREGDFTRLTFKWEHHPGIPFHNSSWGGQKSTPDEDWLIVSNETDTDDYTITLYYRKNILSNFPNLGASFNFFFSRPRLGHEVQFFGNENVGDTQPTGGVELFAP